MQNPFGPIPAAKTGLEGFYQGFTNAQNFFDSLAKRRANEIHSQAMIQEAQRKQQLLPHLIQKYENEASLLPLQKQHLQSQIGEQQSLAGLHGIQSKKTQQEQNLMNQLLNWKPGQNQGQQNIASNNANMQPNIANEEEEEQMAPQMARPTGEQNEMMQNAAESPTIQNKEGQTPSEDMVGKVKVIQESTGNPMLDQMAQQGISLGNIKPKIERKTENGIETTYYPSGKITQQKKGLSDVEKEQLKEANAEKRMQFQTDSKYATELKKETHALTKPYNSLLRAKKILEKRPDLTGWGPALAVRSGRNKDKDVETLNYIFGNIQTEFAKAFGSRAGAQIAALYGRIKPAVFKQGQANLAMVDAGLQLINDYVSTNREDYKDITGKDLAFHSQQPESGNEKITIIDSNGEEHEILGKNLAEARKIDPNIKVKGK